MMAAESLGMQTALQPETPPVLTGPLPTQHRLLFPQRLEPWNLAVTFLVVGEDLDSAFWGWGWYSRDSDDCAALCRPSVAGVLLHSPPCFNCFVLLSLLASSQWVCKQGPCQNSRSRSGTCSAFTAVLARGRGILDVNQKETGFSRSAETGSFYEQIQSRPLHMRRLLFFCAFGFCALRFCPFAVALKPLVPGFAHVSASERKTSFAQAHNGSYKSVPGMSQHGIFFREHRHGQSVHGPASRTDRHAQCRQRTTAPHGPAGRHRCGRHRHAPCRPWGDLLPLRGPCTALVPLHGHRHGPHLHNGPACNTACPQQVSRVQREAADPTHGSSKLS